MLYTLDLTRTEGNASRNHMQIVSSHFQIINVFGQSIINGLATACDTIFAQVSNTCNGPPPYNVLYTQCNTLLE